MRKKPAGFMDGVTQGFLDRFAPVSGFLGGVDGVPFDGTSTIYLPSGTAHWSALGIPVPAFQRPCQDLAGSPVDLVRGAPLAPSGAVTYAQAGSEAQYATLGLGTTDGVASMGFTATSTQDHNPTYQSFVAYFVAEIVALPAALRSLYALTGAGSGYVGLNQATVGKARISTRPTAPVVGTYDYNDARRHAFVVEWILGASIGTHVGAGRFRVSTEKEQITGTWSVVGNGTKGLATGGSASLTSPAAKYFAYDTWVGSDAEWIANTLGAKAFLQRRGWTVVY